MSTAGVGRCRPALGPISHRGGLLPRHCPGLSYPLLGQKLLARDRGQIQAGIRPRAAGWTRGVRGCLPPRKFVSTTHEGARCSTGGRVSAPVPTEQALKHNPAPVRLR